MGVGLFTCKHCGHLSEQPEIHIDDKADKYYRERQRTLEAAEKDPRTVGAGNYWRSYQCQLDLAALRSRHNHWVVCPLCGGCTKFWKE